MGSAIHDFVIALSLANLYQLRVWTSVLCPWSPSRAQHAAAIINTVILAVVLWGAMRLVRRIGAPALLTAARALLVMALLARVPAVVRAIYPVIETAPWFGPARTGWIALSAFAVVVAFAARRGALLSSVASRVLTALVPALLVTAGQSAWNIAAYGHRAIDNAGSVQPVAAATRPKPAARPRPAGEPAAGRAKLRVVVLLLDELDYHLAFVSRPASVRLPALEHLRREAVWATQSYPPAGCTTQSVATWLTGRLVDCHNPKADGGIIVRYHGSAEFVRLEDQRSLFDDLREQGVRPVVVGWGLPYGRLFGSNVCAADLRPGGRGSGRVAEEMLGHFLAAAGDASLPLPHALAQVKDSLPRRAAVATYHAFLAAAERCAADPAARFVFMHAPVPHDPYIFDAATGETTAAPGRTYLDNLVLADRTLARVRAAMDASGEWDRSAVMVVSDHWNRSRPAEVGSDHRTLFALKLPGQRAGVEYSHPFNTVLLHDLWIALLRGELRQPEAVVRWLDRHRTFGESLRTVGSGQRLPCVPPVAGGVAAGATGRAGGRYGNQAPRSQTWAPCGGASASAAGVSPQVSEAHHQAHRRTPIGLATFREQGV